MNRTAEIATQILHQLTEWDEPANEVVVHAAINSRILPAALLSEFNDAITFCESSGWITGVRNALKGTRWALTDKGRAQRHS